MSEYEMEDINKKQEDDDGYNTDVEGGVVGTFQNWWGKGVEKNHKYGVFSGFGTACLCCIPYSLWELVKAFFASVPMAILTIIIIVIFVFTILDWKEDKDQSEEIEKLHCKVDNLEILLKQALGLNN